MKFAIIANQDFSRHDVISVFGSIHLTRVLTILLLVSQLWVWCSPLLPVHYRAQAHFCLKLAALDHHHAHDTHTLQQCMVCVLHHSVTNDQPPPEFMAVWEITDLGEITRLIKRIFYLATIAFRWPQAHAPPVLSAISF